MLDAAFVPFERFGQAKLPILKGMHDGIELGKGRFKRFVTGIGGGHVIWI